MNPSNESIDFSPATVTDFSTSTSDEETKYFVYFLIRLVFAKCSKF